jgi:hypothetical protein
MIGASQSLEIKSLNIKMEKLAYKYTPIQKATRAPTLSLLQT